MRSAPALVALLAAACAAAPGAERAVSSPEPVLLELFTSQGCSSCPPADRLLSRLAAGSGPVVVPLAFHVDYWNHIGWEDPFSQARWSARQQGYARAFGRDGVYTPQLVVDGAEELVGSDERAVRRAIERAAGRGRAGWVRLGAVRLGAEGLAIEVEAGLAAGAPPGRAEVLVALYESGLTTPVGRGENGGRTLANDRVVRALEGALALAGPGSEGRATVELSLAPGWDRRRLGVAAFLQDPVSLAVHGAAAREPVTR